MQTYIMFIGLRSKYSIIIRLVYLHASTSFLKAQFNYASWFWAGSRLVRAEIWPII